MKYLILGILYFSFWNLSLAESTSFSGGEDIQAIENKLNGILADLNSKRSQMGIGNICEYGLKDCLKTLKLNKEVRCLRRKAKCEKKLVNFQMRARRRQRRRAIRQERRRPNNTIIIHAYTKKDTQVSGQKDI